MPKKVAGRPGRSWKSRARRRGGTRAAWALGSMMGRNHKSYQLEMWVGRMGPVTQIWKTVIKGE